MEFKTKNIAIVVDSIDVNDSSGSKANVALIKNLHLAGFNVKVYHYTRKNIQFDSVTCFSIPEKKWNFNYLLSRTQRVIQRNLNINLAKYLEEVFGFSFTFFNDVACIKNYLKNNLNENVDLIITLSKAASFRPHAALLGLPEYHKKWLAYVHDPYPFHYYPEPYNWSEPGYKNKIDFFKGVSEKATYSAFPSKLLKDWTGRFFPNFLKTGIVIPHQSFKDEYVEFKLPEFYKPNEFNILHAGNLTKQRSPLGLLEGFKLFLEKNPEAKNKSKLLLIGSSSYYNDLLNNYINILKGNIYIASKSLPFNLVYNLQKQVSVNVILESNSDISPFLPGKFPHCVQANKPILLLAPTRSETKRLLGSDYPYHSENDNAEKISIILSNLYYNWLRVKDKFVLNREDLMNYISYSYLKNDIDKII